MKNLISLLMLICSLSCKSQTTTESVTISDSLAVKTVREFYTWYIDMAYPQSISYYQIPNYKKLGDKSYVFDLEEYKLRLNSIRFFADSYKKHLIDQLAKCNEEMMKVEWEYEPEPMFNIKACNYLWGNPWVGGQGEEITGYKIQSVYTQGDTKICTVDILINEKPFVKSIVHVKEIGDEYQIVGINLNWKR